MDVQYFSGKVPHELRGQDAHESGEYDQRRRVDLDRGGQGAIVGGAIHRFGAGQRLRRNAEIPRKREPRSIGLVRKHPAYRKRRPGIAALLDKRAHITAASRDEDDDRPPSQRAGHAMTTPRVPARTSPITSASWPISRSRPMARSASSGAR